MLKIVDTAILILLEVRKYIKTMSLI
jgi:hypothetical protein